MRALRSLASLTLAGIMIIVVSHSSMADSDHEKILEQRLSHLELELVQLKAEIYRSRSGGTLQKALSKRTSDQQGTQSSTAGAASLPASANHVTPDTNATDPAAADNATTDKAQALQTFRDNAVTVKQHQVEIETDLGYQRNATSLQSDRLVLGGTSVRYGATDWLELSAQVPYAASFRTTSLGPSQFRSDNLLGVGDASAQANIQLIQQSQNIPGVVGTLGVDFPTGQSPYDLTTYKLDQPGFARTPNPTNIFGDYISRGTWATRINLQMYKTVDPLVFFWGGGVEYPFATRLQSFNVHPGTIYTYNFGASLALSDKTTLGFTVLGAYQDFISVNNRIVPVSSTEPILARLSLIQRFADAWYLEPSIAFGLTSDAPSIYGDLGVRYRF